MTERSRNRPKLFSRSGRTHAQSGQATEPEAVESGEGEGGEEGRELNEGGKFRKIDPLILLLIIELAPFSLLWVYKL